MRVKLGDALMVPNQATKPSQSLRHTVCSYRLVAMILAKQLHSAVPYDSDEQKESATRNSPLKLVLRLLEWESAEGRPVLMNLAVNMLKQQVL